MASELAVKAESAMENAEDISEISFYDSVCAVVAVVLPVEAVLPLVAGVVLVELSPI
jgi:hypothetical protein